MMTLDEYPSFRFGSEDSIDIDRVYVMSKLPERVKCKELCRNQGDNRNIVVLQEGYVLDCYKGIPDEMNNALFTTYVLHAQEHPLPIAGLVERNVPLKVVRATRIILSLLTRSYYRQEIKAALQSNAQHIRMETLSKLDFARILPDVSVDDGKSIAVQLGQTLALFARQECYTKSSIAALFPELEPFLYRRKEDWDANVISDLRDRLVALTSDVYVRYKGTANLFCYISSVAVKEWNPYSLQSRGMIIDLKTERCVTFPYDKFFKLDELEGWRRQDLPVEGPDEIVEKVDGSFVSAYMWEGKVAFACKGNFDVEQSLEATRIAKRYSLQELDFSRYHHTFEVVYPRNRFPNGFAIVDYGDECLYLTGMRDRSSNALLPYAAMEEVAIRAGLRVPARYPAELSTILDHAAQDGWNNFEGWVANFAGKRVKIKTRGYNRINEIINHFKHGSHRLLKKYCEMEPPDWQAYIEILPADFLHIIKAELRLLEETIEALRVQLDEILESYKKNTTEHSQEAFAVFVIEQVKPVYHKLLFRYARGQSVSRTLQSYALQEILEAGKTGATVQWSLLLEPSDKKI